MQITVKIKYGTNKQSIESFGNNRFLIYLLTKKDDVFAWEELIAVLAKQFGVPQNKIELRKEIGDSKVFEI